MLHRMKPHLTPHKHIKSNITGETTEIYIIFLYIIEQQEQVLPWNYKYG